MPPPTDNLADQMLGAIQSSLEIAPPSDAIGTPFFESDFEVTKRGESLWLTVKITNYPPRVFRLTVDEMEGLF